jgi:hypothetical protein
VHDVERGIERGAECARDVTRVDDRSPRCPVAEDAHLAGQQRTHDEIVEHEIKAETWRPAVRRRVAQRDRREAVVRELVEPLLDPNFRLGVRRDGTHRCVLVHDVIAAARPVDAARRREHETGHAGVAGNASEPQRGLGVDRVGESGVEVAERVVREGTEMDDGVDAPAHRRGEISQVHGLRRGGRGRTVVAVREVPDVETDDLVAGRREHRPNHRPEVAVRAREQDAHQCRSRSARARYSSPISTDVGDASVL